MTQPPLPRPRLLLVGTDTTDTQVFLDDQDLTSITQRVEFNLDARERIGRATLTLLTQGGFQFAAAPTVAIAFLPARGLRWRRQPEADGSVTFRCEVDVDPDTSPRGF